jgi:asparagine synthase (glutamine-hydrolysing)
MCGLVALFAASPAAAPVDPAEARLIRDHMAARGPDGCGLWVAPGGRVALGHRRLSILDLSASGAQPMASDDGRVVIVFNGEVYNFREIAAGLEAEGARFRSGSDTEVVLELYRRHGPDSLSRLRGMFALVLWDERDRRLLAARDGLGIKPLYVAEAGGTVRLASQVKALLAGGRIDTRPDPAGHAGFFLWGHVPEPHTLYRGIRALAPGSWESWDESGAHRTGRFYDLTETIRNGGRAGNGTETLPDLKDALSQSVAHHLIADVPVGLFLSAGLDSTTLCALAAARAPGRLRTVTLGFAEFEGTPGDEVPLAELAAAHYATDQASVRVRAAEFAEARDRILADMDQPSIDGVNVWFVARAAARLGLKVALSGLGGDELFAGYDTFRKVPRLVALAGPLAAVPGLGSGLRRMSAGLARRLGRPKAAGLVEWGGRLPDAYFLRRALFLPWDLPSVMDPEMAKAGLEALDLRATLARAVAGIDDPRRALSCLEMTFYMRNQLLRDADWAGMAHGVEIRVPLVDTELLDTVLRLDRAGRPPSKRDMAACAEPPLPAALIDRPKTGFSVPVARWLGETSLRGWAARVHPARTEGS